MESIPRDLYHETGSTIMAWLTLFNAVTETPCEELAGNLSERLSPLGWTLGEIQSLDGGSFMVQIERSEPAMTLALGLRPIEEGGFTPPDYDEGFDRAVAASMRTVCRIGATEGPDPSETVRFALSLAANLARGGRIYDAHSRQAFDEQEAADRSARPFDIRDYVRYHYLAPPSGESSNSWLHIHGMAKFFCPEIEAFDVHPEVSHKALGLMMSIAQGLATGCELAPGEPQPLGHGAYRLRWSTEVRPNLEHFSESDFDEEHSDAALVIEDAGNFGSLDKLVRGAYEMEPKTRDECEAEHRVWHARLDAIRNAWATRRDDQFMVRAAFEVGMASTVEHIWVAVDSWEDTELNGRLLNDAFNDPSAVRGTPVSFEENLISAVALVRGNRALDEFESLREIDSDAAALLDAACGQDRGLVRTQESTSPDGKLRARFEIDGRVAYLFVLDTESGTPACDPLWLFNMLQTPPLLEPRCFDGDLLPLMSEVQTCQSSPDVLPPVDRVEFEWDEHRVTLTLDGQPWAHVDVDQGRGWSRLLTLPCRYGLPWPEDSNEVTRREGRPDGR